MTAYNYQPSLSVFMTQTRLLNRIYHLDNYCITLRISKTPISDQWLRFKRINAVSMWSFFSHHFFPLSLPLAFPRYFGYALSKSFWSHCRGLLHKTILHGLLKIVFFRTCRSWIFPMPQQTLSFRYPSILGDRKKLHKRELYQQNLTPRILILLFISLSISVPTTLAMHLFIFQDVVN